MRRVLSICGACFVVLGDLSAQARGALVIDPKTPTTLYAQASSNGGDGIFKSTDGGATWTFCNLGSPGTR